MGYEIKIDMPRMESKMQHALCAVKAVNEEGVFAGYASVFHLVDSQQDVMLPGAFASTLEVRGREVKLLWQHDQKDPIGVIEELREDANGLYIRARLMLDLARGREAYQLLKQGVISGLSIGYTPTRFHVDPETGIRSLNAVDLWEVSLVTFPANHAAQVTALKNAAVQYNDERDDDWKSLVQCGVAMKFAHEIERATRILQQW